MDENTKQGLKALLLAAVVANRDAEKLYAEKASAEQVAEAEQKAERMVNNFYTFLDHVDDPVEQEPDGSGEEPS